MDYTLKDTWTQRDADLFDAELATLMFLRMRGTSSNYAAHVRAAIGAGWFVEPETSKREITERGKTHTEYLIDGKPVAEYHPAVIAEIGRHVGRIYDSFLGAADPN